VALNQNHAKFIAFHGFDVRCE